MLEQKIHDDAVEIKKELSRPENAGALEENLPTPVAEAVKEVIDQAAGGRPDDDWESANGQEDDGRDDYWGMRVVKVYNFPMRPWSAINLLPTTTTRPRFRDDSIMDIARLKKEFDQVDRTLATATKDHIVYAMSKHSGFRIIRQDNAQDKHAFKDAQDRIFNVSATMNPDTVLATGVSGAVYWLELPGKDSDAFSGWDVHKSGFTYPPTSGQGNIMATGGQLKTRAKTSARHPEYFAVGRGRIIHIVHALAAKSKAYINEKTRVVDSEKYLQDHCRKVNTGKASKDFTFSEDDSAIISLDKRWQVKDMGRNISDRFP